MNASIVLPKRLVSYLHDNGTRALDKVAEHAGESSALLGFANHWNAMSREEKEHFVDRVAVTFFEVAAAAALLPIGAKLRKKVAKSARKAIKRQSKALKKVATAGKKSSKKKTKKKSAKAS